ncbi:hypothetical protein B0I37DRAFT_36799 [Chaetomium sp. MPI-CAGE-AT-0009]|nr:hypothetical protein B0I37DRAFT_36799 [Chaetomium sp. MPI-CAGE-AT-0009]
MWLLAEFLRCWHQTVDTAAWGITDLANQVEQTTFQEAAKLLDAMEEQAKPLPLFKAHVVAKNAIYNLEALDSTLRCLEKSIECHSNIEKRSPYWLGTHESLLYTAELFKSTRYRILSVDTRMKNVINLVFNLQTMRDSRIMQQDSRVLRGHSRTVRAISLLTMTFLPFSAVSTVFGTQFFGYYSSGPQEEPQRFQVNPAFWIMFVFAVPLTVLVVGWWYMWEKGSHWRWWNGDRRYGVSANAVDNRV